MKGYTSVAVVAYTWSVARLSARGHNHSTNNVGNPALRTDGELVTVASESRDRLLITGTRPALGQSVSRWSPFPQPAPPGQTWIDIATP